MSRITIVSYKIIRYIVIIIVVWLVAGGCCLARPGAVCCVLYVSCCSDTAAFALRKRLLIEAIVAWRNSAFRDFQEIDHESKTLPSKITFVMRFGYFFIRRSFDCRSVWVLCFCAITLLACLFKRSNWSFFFLHILHLCDIRSTRIYKWIWRYIV